jgi:hypothetical protein
MADIPTFIPGDTYPHLVLTLTSSTGTALPLSGASVRVRIRPVYGGPLLVDGAATVADAASARVQYAWTSSAETASARGDYLVDAVVTYADGVQTVPSPSAVRIRFLPKRT